MRCLPQHLLGTASVERPERMQAQNAHFCSLKQGPFLIVTVVVSSEVYIAVRGGDADRWSA